MRTYKIYTDNESHYGLTYDQMRLKECFYRALRQDYTIVYPDNITITVKINS
ncbi:hypothetical protein [Aquimarina latercula]|uniref:hypothetical protein n=1 Tax=Aquimarina latercula TaxID=987 RepID=UPI0012DFC5E6|nr:hypothetical protein [Aquimarina latercula]